MKKRILIAAAALVLTGCGNTIENRESVPVVVPEVTSEVADTVTTDEPLIVIEEGDSAAETTAAPTTSAPEQTTTLKKIDPELVTAACMDTVEVFTQVRQSDFMFDTNGKLLDGDTLIDTSSAGVHETTLKIQLDDGVAEKKVTYTVTDSTPPVFLLADDFTVQTGSAFSMGANISYGDNSDAHPVMSYDGDVDTSKPGVYPLTVFLSDASGNMSSKQINVTVSDEVPSTSYDAGGESLDFTDFVNRYADGSREFGIDVSHWQGDIDFGAVKNAGCSFAIIRMGYGSNGGTDLDENYFTNLENAKAAGLQVGVYFYITDTTKEGAKATAKKIIDTLGGQKLDFPVAFDWEEFYNFQDYGISLHDLCEVYETFAEEMEKSGYEAMLYSSKNFLENTWENRKDRPIWLAHYVEQTSYEGKWFLWQRCGYGRIDGINGDVDLNVLQRSGR